MCPALCDLHRYSGEQNIVPALKELRVSWARQTNRMEEYGPSSIHPVNKYLLSIYYVPRTVLGAGDLVVRKTDKTTVLMELAL